MLLTIDVGNTHIALGVFDQENLVGHWRMSTDSSRTSDEIGLFLLSLLAQSKLDVADITAVAICSVVPPVMHSLLNAIRRYIQKEPLLVEPGVKTGINIKYENPREVGADKIANAVGALKHFKGPMIVVDFGTATTFCAIGSKNDYLGGVICPGIKISSEALFEKASKLPRIDIVKPAKIIGKTTVASMQSGLIHGFVGQVDHIVRLMRQEMKDDSIRVVATGGMARLISAESDTINDVLPMLTLEGLQEIYRLNLLEG